MQKAKIAISYSGGKDSTAMLLLAKEMGLDFIATYQDTGFEHSVHYEYLDYIEKATGVEIVRIQSEKYNGMFDLIEKRNALPNGLMRFCTEELKQKPFANWLENYPEIKEVWIGVRAQESAQRMARNKDKTFDTTFPIWEYAVYGKRKFPDVVVRLPIVEWSEKDVWAMHEKYSIKPNPLYEQGFQRVGCFPCVASSEKSWFEVYKSEQGKQNIHRLNELEKKVQESRGQTYTYLRKHKPLQQLINEMEVRLSQGDLFPDDNQCDISCSWCSE
jgi:3'-phosphoadenosine 5'-phosphosulfate sulfotransferase (PAPS reductase)/FAD synthetase